MSNQSLPLIAAMLLGIGLVAFVYGVTLTTYRLFNIPLIAGGGIALIAIAILTITAERTELPEA